MNDRVITAAILMVMAIGVGMVTRVGWKLANQTTVQSELAPENTAELGREGTSDSSSAPMKTLPLDSAVDTSDVNNIPAASAQTNSGKEPDEKDLAAMTMEQLRATPLTKKEIKSIDQYVNLLTAGYQGLSAQGSNDIVESLKKMGLEPAINTDSNSITGTLNIIRTENTLPGTRYFHAQVFTDENGKEFTQHVSFQVRPGRDSFEKSIEAIEKSLPPDAVRSESTMDSVAWNLPNGIQVSVVITSPETLAADPFSPTRGDEVGTVTINREDDVEEAYTMGEGP